MTEPTVNAARRPWMAGVPLAIVAGLAMACGGAPPRPSKLPEVVWPPPPEVARFKLERILTGEIDYYVPPSPLRRFFFGSRKPSEMKRLAEPTAIACHPTRNMVYAYDLRFRTVFAFDEEARKLRFYGRDRLGALGASGGLAVDDQGTVYATDSRARRVYAYEANGTLAATYGEGGELTRPVGVAVDRGRGRLYVSDAGTHDIHVFELSTEKHIATWGKRGRQGEMAFNFPTFLALDRQGNLLVSDSANFRYMVVSPEGKQLRTVGSMGTFPGSFLRPKGVAVDSEGHIYVADGAFNNVQVFDGEGRLLMPIGHGGPKPGELALPVGVCVGKDDVLWVADRLNGRLQGIRYLHNANVPSYVPPPSKTPPSSDESTPEAGSGPERPAD